MGREKKERKEESFQKKKEKITKRGRREVLERIKIRVKRQRTRDRY